jgi:CHAT domain
MNKTLLDGQNIIAVLALAEALKQIDVTLSEALLQKIQAIAKELSNNQCTDPALVIGELADEVEIEITGFYDLYLDARIPLQTPYENKHRGNSQGSADEFQSADVLDQSLNFLQNYGVSTNSTGSSMSQSDCYLYYTDISCPRRIYVETPRISVVVRLRIKPPKYSDAPVQKLSVNTELPVRVRIDAPAFNILCDAEQEIIVQPNTDSIPLVFDVQPRSENIAHTHINFDFFQAGNPIGNTASIPVEITAYEVSSQPEPIQGILKRSTRHASPPDLKLYVKYEGFHNKPALCFTLFQGDSVGYELPPIPMDGDLKTYAASLYKKLENLTNNTAIDNRISAKPNQKRFVDNYEVLENTDCTMKNIGFKLWEELIPSELKTIYLKNRKTWSQQKLLLVSDEAYIPWELVWPYDKNKDWEDDVPWCMSLQMTRWLRRNAEGNGHEVAPTELYLKKLACIAPQDANLPYALKEREFLNQHIAKYKLDDVSPNYSSLRAVRELLKEAEYNWLHIASHGLYDADTPDDVSAIILENGERLTLDEILGAKVQGHIKKKRPGFVFNACHSGRQAWALTGLGGWPNRLISSGAGLFIAPLWKVRDDLALEFAETFYQELFKGKTVAEAVHSSRLAAKIAGDSTWLAYSVYAHPNATIICRESED